MDMYRYMICTNHIGEIYTSGKEKICLQVVLSAAILGVEVCPVQVEADVSNGLPSFIMVGFPSAQVKEAQDRVRTALKNNGYQFPPKRITVNFAPADMKKEGAGFDVPVAAAVLAAFEIISSRDVNGVMMAGEIGLDGEIHAFRESSHGIVCEKSWMPILRSSL